MALSCAVNSSNRSSGAAASEPAWSLNLRYYFAGDPRIGFFPNQLDGQAEILKATAIKPAPLATK
jgi:hypothetical protein